MKKLSYVIASFSIGALLLVGCAKENNKYDKILTDGTWKVSSIDSKTVSTDVLLVGGTSTTHTVTTTEKTTGGVQTMTKVTANTGSSDETVESVSTYSGTVAFTADGSYTMTSSALPTHYKNTSIPYDGTITGVAAATTEMSEIWSWANTGDTKTQINIGGSIYKIMLEKNKVVLTISTSSKNVTPINLTDNETMIDTYTATMTFVK
jgi:hypothetical protein